MAVSAHYNFTRRKFKPLIGLGYRFTQASWQPEHENGDVFNDHINQFEVFGGVNYNIGKIVGVELQGGYKLADDVELTGLPKNSYDGLFFRLALKITLFKIRNEY